MNMKKAFNMLRNQFVIYQAWAGIDEEGDPIIFSYFCLYWSVVKLDPTLCPDCQSPGACSNGFRIGCFLIFPYCTTSKCIRI